MFEDAALIILSKELYCPLVIRSMRWVITICTFIGTHAVFWYRDGLCREHITSLCLTVSVCCLLLDRYHKVVLSESVVRKWMRERNRKRSGLRRWRWRTWPWWRWWLSSYQLDVPAFPFISALPTEVSAVFPMKNMLSRTHYGVWFQLTAHETAYGPRGLWQEGHWCRPT